MEQAQEQMFNHSRLPPAMVPEMVRIVPLESKRPLAEPQKAIYPDS